MSRRVALVIPTLNAGERWQECLNAVSAQSLTPARKLVIDSSSGDETVPLARKAGFEIRQIPKSEFNHGRTRQLAVEYLNDCDLVVFLTQDAILASKDSLARLVSCLDDPGAVIAYGRQLPHRRATAIEAHARLFNYGGVTQRKDLAAKELLGAKVFFCSNSFAGYRRAALLELGGFRSDVILAEDAELAARALLAGYANVYCAEATVYHSHDYTVGDIFSRYFDTGVFHARNPWLGREFGSHQGEGLRFALSELRYLGRNAPMQIPRSVGHTLAKVVAYRLGRLEALLPPQLKCRLSMNPGYWRESEPFGTDTA